MDLVCTAVPMIGFMVTAYYVGFGLGGFAYALPDRIGRKNCIIFSLILSCICQTVMFMTSNFVVRTIVFFFMGLC